MKRPARTNPSWWARLLRTRSLPCRVGRPLRLETLEDRVVPASTITILDSGVGSLDSFLSATDGLLTTDDGGATPGTLSRAALEVVGAGVDISISALDSISFDDLSSPLNLLTGAGNTASFSTGTGTLAFTDTSDTLTTAGGNLTLSAATTLTTANLTTTGNITLEGGAGITLPAGVAVQAGGTVALNVGQTSTDSTSTLAGSLSGTSATLQGGSGADSVTVNLAASPALNLSTGDGNDTVSFADGASLFGGTVDGGAGTDSLDYSAFTSAVAVNLGLGSTGLSAALDGDQEITPQNTTATGTATLSNYDPVAKTFDLSLTVSNLDPASVTGLELDRGAFGVNGPAIIDLLPLASLVPSEKGFTYTATDVSLGASNEAAFLGGVTYLNVKSGSFPNGQIRGQVFTNGNTDLSSVGTATATAGVSNVENAIGGSADDGLVGSFLANVLQGGAGNDVLVGAAGADSLSGGDNDDVLVWSNGDGSDVMNGDAGADTVQVNGNPTSADVFTVGASSSRIAFNRTSAGPFSLDVGTTETLTVNGIGGADGFTVNDLTGVSDLSTLNLNGLADNDTFLVNPGATAAINITGGANDDAVTFGSGATLDGGTVHGDAGTDTLDYSAYTTAVGVNLGLGTTGLSATLDGDQEVPSQTTTASGTATVSNYNAVTKTFDLSLTVSNLDPASVTGLELDRGAFGVNGSTILNLLPLGSLSPSGTGFTFNVTGLSLASTSLGGVANEAAFLGGVTYLNVKTKDVPNGLIRGQVFTNGNVDLGGVGSATATDGITGIENVIGGSGDDGLVGSFLVNSLQGGFGDDVLVGGPGNDTISGGSNNDVLVWSNGDGTDVMDGDAGADTVQVNGNPTSADVFTVGASGSRVAFARTSAGPFSLDVGSTETLTVNGLGGADSFTVNDLTGVADLSLVNLNGLADADTFQVAPEPSVAVAVSGDAPIPPTSPGDTLNVTLTGTTTPALSSTSGTNGFTGTWTFANRQSVLFQGVETLNPAGVNTAPTLDTGVAVALNSIIENGPDAVNLGTSIDTLVNTPGLYGDADGFPPAGLAVTGADDSPGTWQFSTDGGHTWQDFGALSDASATLLAADGGGVNRVRFVPEQDFNGSATLDFRAWDGSDQLASGSTEVTITATGGNTAYSANTATASIAVVARPATVGAFDASTGTWYLRNSNSAGAPDFTPFQYGLANWKPVVGDWDANGTQTVGVFDPQSATWYLRNSNSAGAADVTPFAYGFSAWTPVVGDWDGNGTATVAAVDASGASSSSTTWYLRNSNSEGGADVTLVFGLAHWLPVVGDWNGDGIATPGIYDPSTATWYLRNSNDPLDESVTTVVYGFSSWLPVVGDWDGNGTATVGVFDPSSATWYLRNSNSAGDADFTPFPYGFGSWVPVAGYWANVQPVAALTDTTSLLPPRAGAEEAGGLGPAGDPSETTAQDALFGAF